MLASHRHADHSRDRPQGRSLRAPEQGDMDKATVFSEDPARWPGTGLEQGARRLHLVDLNGAFAGKPRERGGDPGHRRARSATRFRSAGRRHPRPGHHRALSGRRHELRHHRHGGGEEPRLPARSLRRVSAATSSSASTPRTARSRSTAGPSSPGTTWSTSRSKFEDYGVEAVIYTDIGRDGMLTGVNIEATVQPGAQALNIPRDRQRRPHQPG